MVNCGSYENYRQQFDVKLSHLTDIQLMNLIKKSEIEIMALEESIIVYKNVLESRKQHREETAEEVKPAVTM